MDNAIVSLISRRRRQILVHSCIYYELNKNIISDDQWSRWAKELSELQEKYPEESSNAAYYNEFIEFDYSTGQNLRDTFMKPEILSVAIRLCGIPFGEAEKKYGKPKEMKKRGQQTRMVKPTADA